MSDERLRSNLLPGGSLVAALFDREVMTLADRGGASNLIGHRWADLAAAHAATWAESGRSIQAGGDEPFPIVRVERLDATPRIARVASQRGLQNPDLLLIGQRGSRQALQAVDAKFSVETARSKQVSPEVVLGLLTIRDVVPELIPDLSADVEIESGLFLSPDYPLTHLMLRRRHGIVRTTVRRDEVELLPAPADRFWEGVEGASIIGGLAAVDDLPVRSEASLMAGVYYFRLARAAVGFWLDATKPLLQFNDIVAIDEARIREEAMRRANCATSAFGLIRHWDSDVQRIRDQRAAVEQVAGLPIPGRDLRPMVARIAESIGAEAPSVNQVRRRLGAWYRGELRARIGPVIPPVADLPAILGEIAAAGRELAPRAETVLEQVVRDLIADSVATSSEVLSPTASLKAN